MRPGEAPDDVAERIRDGFQEDVRNSGWESRSQRIAQTGGILNGGPLILPGYPYGEDPTILFKLVQDPAGRILVLTTGGDSFG